MELCNTLSRRRQDGQIALKKRAVVEKTDISATWKSLAGYAMNCTNGLIDVV